MKDSVHEISSDTAFAMMIGAHAVGEVFNKVAGPVETVVSKVTGAVKKIFNLTEEEYLELKYEGLCVPLLGSSKMTNYGTMTPLSPTPPTPETSEGS